MNLRYRFTRSPIGRRSGRNDEAYAQLRRQIFVRDGWRCQGCGSSSNSRFTTGKVQTSPKLSTALNAKLQVLTDATSLSFTALDAKIEDGLQIVAKDWNALLPYLLEMNRRLRAPGRRNYLRRGAPAGLTWTEWVQSKRSHLGRSLRSIQYMLSDKTEASRQLRLLEQPRAELREEPELSLPRAPLEIASEMAQMILETREIRQNLERLERLAEQFLAITGSGFRAQQIRAGCNV